ncbi:MAG TPA: hypothetical protein DD670_16975 [Planctomycetaceae bacterium]|nr:hypothetical protein [Planctomycetaceae bacterium]
MVALLESPMPVLFAGVIAVAILAVAFVNTQRAVFLLAIVGAVLLTLLGLAIEHLVVTPREEVEAELDALAAAMVANDAPAVLGHMSPSVDSRTRARAEWALARFTIQEAKVSNLTIEVNDLTSPPSAKARFKGFIRVADTQGLIPGGQALLNFTVDYRREGDRWLIVGHTESAANLGGGSPE